MISVGGGRLKKVKSENPGRGVKKPEQPVALRGRQRRLIEDTHRGVSHNSSSCFKIQESEEPIRTQPMAPAPTNTPVTAHPIGTRHVLFPVQQAPGLGLVILMKLNLIDFLFLFFIYLYQPLIFLSKQFLVPPPKQYPVPQKKKKKKNFFRGSS
jgi:hypothetical protein